MAGTSDKGLSRRTLVSSAVAAGLVATAGGILLPRRSGEVSPREKVGSGGRVRAAGISLSTADTLDPAKGALSSDYIRHYMLYSCLTELDKQQKPIPSLAETIETADQTVWHLSLRKGVTFHDGKTLAAADVVYSLMRHKDPATLSKMATIMEQFAEVRADDALNVIITLTGPNADLPTILSQSHFAIVPEGETKFRTGNGTGPFRLVEFSPGVRTLVHKNANYWKPGLPRLNEVELIGIPDEVSRVNALLSGDVQMVFGLNPRSTKRINETPGYIARETPSGLYTNLIMRQDQTPTDNAHLVQALKYLMDRPLMKRAVFRGYATIANDQPIPPFHPYYRDDLPQTALDLDRARWHLRQSGLGNVHLPIFASPAAEGSIDMASVLQEYAGRIGLDLAVNRVPADGFWSTHWMKHPLGFANTNPRPTADMLFSLFYKSGAAWNESGWKNERFDRLLVEARGAGDDALRKQLYGEMQALVREKCGTAIPVFISLIDGWDRRIKGWYPVPLGGLMGYTFAEHVWWED